jgi:hypothetical protein
MLLSRRRKDDPMGSKISGWVVTPVVVLACILPDVVTAQTQRSGGGASAQLAAQMQMLAAERTTLQAENARLKGDLEQARKERDALKAVQEGIARRSRGADAELARAQADNARLEGDLARQKEREQELISKFRETATALRDVESDRAAKTQQLARGEQELKSCVERNARLYTLNGEVVAKLEDQGFWSAFASSEPFTRLKRTQLQNLADDYRSSAEDNRITPAPVQR